MSQGTLENGPENGPEDRAKEHSHLSNQGGACPLCGAAQLSAFYQDKRRDYLLCGRCQLVSVPDHQLLSPAEEKAEYDKHENDPADEGYQRFLGRCVKPLFAQLPPGAAGLDFGCGPGPAISQMAIEHGLSMTNYDPMYFPDVSALKQPYDFITMTEVIEHIHQPMLVLEKLASLLSPGAVLAVMTKRWESQQAFGAWHYKNDPTHIRFYSADTFRFLARRFSWSVQWVERDVVFFRVAG